MIFYYAKKTVAGVQKEWYNIAGYGKVKRGTGDHMMKKTGGYYNDNRCKNNDCIWQRGARY